MEKTKEHDLHMKIIINVKYYITVIFFLQKRSLVKIILSHIVWEKKSDVNEK